MKRYLLILMTIIVLFSSVNAQDDSVVVEEAKDSKNFVTDINKNDLINEMSIHDAVRAKDIEMVRFLISEKTELNVSDKYGYTPLHLAVRFNDLEIAKLLFENDAKLNSVDNYKDTPLLDSTRNKSSEISKFLICNGASRNVSDINGMTPLHYASKTGDLNIAKMLRAKNLDEYCNALPIEPEAKEEVKIEEVPEPIVEPVKTQEVFYKTLYEALNEEFKNDYDKWNAELDKDTLTFRFKSPDLMFVHAKSDLRNSYQNVLSDFFPRYIKILNDYKKEIESVFVEGHSSSVYRLGKTQKEKFDFNMKLSQNRANSVFKYISSLDNQEITSQKDWINSTFQAVGKSSLELIKNSDGSENEELSRRVEFSIKTIDLK